MYADQKLIFHYRFAVPTGKGGIVRTSIFVTLLMASASMGHAGNVLVGTDNSGGGVDYVGNQGDLYTDDNSDLQASYGNLGWAQGFTLNQAVIATDVSVWASYYNVASTFDLEITDGLSNGADILFSGAGTFGASPAWVDLSLGGLNLAAGNYYLVMTSDTPVPALFPDGSNCPITPPSGKDIPTVTCFQTGLWGSLGTDISTAGSVGPLYLGFGSGLANDSPGPGLSDINDPVSGNVEFQLTSAVPEPGTFVLLIGGALALLGKRKFAR